MQTDPLEQWLAHRRSQFTDTDLSEPVVNALTPEKAPSVFERFSVWAEDLFEELPYPVPFASASCGGILRVSVVFVILFFPN